MTVTPDHTDPRAGDIRHSHADITAARRDLGYEPAPSRSPTAWPAPSTGSTTVPTCHASGASRRSTDEESQETTR